MEYSWKIEIISGAFMMMRKTALDKVGLLDEDFFMYGEDIDLSYRLMTEGYDNWYIPAKSSTIKGKAHKIIIPLCTCILRSHAHLLTQAL